MESTLLRLDIAPLQVLIEATIAEVLLNNALRYGVQYFIKNEGIAFGFNSGAQASGDFGINPLAIIPGFNFLYTGGNSNVTIDALSRVTDVKVLSSPSVVVQDNREATLTVGDEVPITTRQAVSVEDVDAPVVNSIEYRNTGVILQVRPRINVDGAVSLDIAQEVSRVADAAQAADGRPHADHHPAQDHEPGRRAERPDGGAGWADRGCRDPQPRPGAGPGRDPGRGQPVRLDQHHQPPHRADRLHHPARDPQRAGCAATSATSCAHACARCGRSRPRQPCRPCRSQWLHCPPRNPCRCRSRHPQARSRWCRRARSGRRRPPSRPSGRARPASRACPRSGCPIWSVPGRRPHLPNARSRCRRRRWCSRRPSPSSARLRPRRSPPPRPEEQQQAVAPPVVQPAPPPPAEPQPAVAAVLPPPSPPPAAPEPRPTMPAPRPAARPAEVPPQEPMLLAAAPARPVAMPGAPPRNGFDLARAPVPSQRPAPEPPAPRPSMAPVGTATAPVEWE